MVESHANSCIFGDVIGQIAIGAKGAEFRMRSLSDRRTEVVSAFMSQTKAVVPTVDAAVNRCSSGLAVGSIVHAGRDFSFERLIASLFCDDVDGAANSIRAIKNGGRPLDHFNAFDHGRVNQHRRAGHGLVFSNFLTINHDKRAEGVFASDLSTLHALPTVAVNLNARHIFEKITNSAGF